MKITLRPLYSGVMRRTPHSQPAWLMWRSSSPKPMDLLVSTRETLDEIKSKSPYRPDHVRKIQTAATFLRSLGLHHGDLKWQDFMTSATRMEGWLQAIQHRLQADLLTAKSDPAILPHVKNLSEILVCLVSGWQNILIHNCATLGELAIDQYRKVSAVSFTRAVKCMFSSLDLWINSDVSDAINLNLKNALFVLNEIAIGYP